MPTYEYQCPRCLNVHDIIKSLAEFERSEECPTCLGQFMERRIAQVQINTSNCQFQSHFNHAFGKVIHNKRQIKDQVSRIKSETGKEIVEVGTDNLKSIKKKHTPYTID